MNQEEAADRLRRAELEFHAAQREHDGSFISTERYRAAVSELLIAMSVVQAILAG